jgi:hypothetical protein
MELTTTIAVFYFAGVLTAMYSLYIPAWNFVRAADPNNIMVRLKIRAAFVVFFLFSLVMPFLILVMLIPSVTNDFIKGFAKGMMGIKT